MQPALKRLNSCVIYSADEASSRLFQILTTKWIKLLPEECIRDYQLFQGMAWHTQAWAGCTYMYWAVVLRKHGFQIRWAQIGMHPIQDCCSCNLPPMIRRRDVQFGFCFLFIYANYVQCLSLDTVQV